MRTGKINIIVSPELMSRLSEERRWHCIYFRILRATCNCARREGQPLFKDLFTNVYTGKAKTKKRALRMAGIRRIAAAKTIGGQHCWRYAAVFATQDHAEAVADCQRFTWTKAMEILKRYKGKLKNSCRQSKCTSITKAYVPCFGNVASTEW